jgi:hypothetical protein
MNYDLSRTNKESRKRFVRYANSLLRNECRNARLENESGRTLNQNSYIHVLCRILALDIGVTEAYAKQVYLKTYACPDIFKTITKDPITNELTEVIRSVKDLTVPEMRHVIKGFRDWAAHNGYYLPDATIADDGTMAFASDKDKEAFNQAEIQTSTLDEWA